MTETRIFLFRVYRFLVYIKSAIKYYVVKGMWVHPSPTPHGQPVFGGVKAFGKDWANIMAGHPLIRACMAEILTVQSREYGNFQRGVLLKTHKQCVHGL